MAAVLNFFIGPATILTTIGFLHGPDKTIPTPKEDWHNAVVDLIIPTYNEQRNISLCLASIAKQTMRPRSIILIDDNSKDNTVLYAKEFSKLLGLELKILKRTTSEGKTPSLSYGAHETDADVEFILDGDTLLESENYIERLVEELYKGIGIASACGVILPLREEDYHAVVNHTPSLKTFEEQNPSAKFIQPHTLLHRLGQGMVHAYRNMLYQFLQRFIYQGQMTFFGSIINPVGCAVAYRRKYIKDVLDNFAETLGLDLTTSEDIFIGFAFISLGYRNIQLQDVQARTKEPSLQRLPRQVFLWSSSFLQSCYYFDAILKTPFRMSRLYFKRKREKNDPEYQKILERRKIKEAYRQAFGEAYTKQYGRPLGWYIFISAFEKISYPTVLLMLILWGSWEPLLLTFCAELALFSVIAAIVARPGGRMINFGRSLLIAPMRYSLLMYDIYIIAMFAYDIWFRNDKKWRK